MDTSTLPHHTALSASRHFLKTATLAAAILYSVVWIVGLFVPVPVLTVDSSQLETWDKYAHNATAFVQALLVHGLASIFLTIVAISAAQSASGRGWGSSRSRWIAGSGVAAAAISIVQFVIEASLVVGSFGVSKTNARDFWLVLNRLDGIKMFALAALVAAFAMVDRNYTTEEPFLPAWLRIVNVLTAIALVLSGLGYAFLNAPLMLAAWASLPLLLLSITATGIIRGRHLGNHAG